MKLKLLLQFLITSTILVNNSLLSEVSSSNAAPNDGIYALKQLKINKNHITLSGFSAGGSMSTQFHVAHSSLFSGAAIFGQVYYRCGPRSLVEFAVRCSKYGFEILPYNVQKGIADAKHYDKTYQIDSLRSLSNQKVFIWVAGTDEYVPPRQAMQNIEFYQEFIPKDRIFLKLEKTAKHLFPTDNFGAACNQDAGNNLYLGNCQYSGAYESLSYLIGRAEIQKATADDVNHVPISSQLKVFDQTEFYIDDDTDAESNTRSNITKIGMGQLGHVYIPSDCESGEIECYLHFNFHGCNEWPLNLGRNYSINSGFLPVAEKNNIIVVFPLTTAIPSNMNGCWDFFSYTGNNFATKHGEQIKVVHRMLQRIVNGS